MSDSCLPWPVWSSHQACLMSILITASCRPWRSCQRGLINMCHLSFLVNCLLSRHFICQWMSARPRQVPAFWQCNFSFLSHIHGMTCNENLWRGSIPVLHHAFCYVSRASHLSALLVLPVLRTLSRRYIALSIPLWKLSRELHVYIVTFRDQSLVYRASWALLQLLAAGFWHCTSKFGKFTGCCCSGARFAWSWQAGGCLCQQCRSLLSSWRTEHCPVSLQSSQDLAKNPKTWGCWQRCKRHTWKARLIHPSIGWLHSRVPFPRYADTQVGALRSCSMAIQVPSLMTFWASSSQLWHTQLLVALYNFYKSWHRFLHTEVVML